MLGDFNYRIYNEEETIRKLIKMTDFEELAKNDEFK